MRKETLVKLSEKFNEDNWHNIPNNVKLASLLVSDMYDIVMEMEDEMSKAVNNKIIQRIHALCTVMDTLEQSEQMDSFVDVWNLVYEFQEGECC